MKLLVRSVCGLCIGLLMVLSLIIMASYVNHKIKLNEEDEWFVANGKIVEVNNHKIHVYTEGEGEETLVFMSGGGTSSPVLDFKSLYSLLSDQQKIAVVEKQGYGFSEDGKVARDIDTILGETRAALKEAGLNAPYILLPHSMSGIEALYWAQKYPDEVKAIAGLDMAVPDIYDDYKVNGAMLSLLRFGSHIGVTRWLPGGDQSDAIKYGSLSNQEKELYKIVFYRRTLTGSMVNEIKHIKTNASQVQKGRVPSIPILAFSSNGEGTGWDKEVWKDTMKDYIGTADKGKIVDLDCSHYVHDIEYEEIAAQLRLFLEGLEK